MTLVPTINARIEKINKQIDETQSITNSEFPPYKLLIITPQKFERYLKPLKVHKEKYGITTYIATLDEIYEKMYWNGRDKAEKIKYYIKESMKTGEHNTFF